MTENRTKASEALRAFQDKMIVIIGVALLMAIASWVFINLISNAANADASMMTHALRRAQCEDAREAWSDHGVGKAIGILIAIGVFPVILVLRATRNRRDVQDALPVVHDGGQSDPSTKKEAGHD